MGIPVTLVMINFLCLNYIDGTYVFEKVVSQMTGIGATKKWLSFMEIRIKTCLSIRQIPHFQRHDLIGLVRCLVTRPMSQRRCYIHRNWVIWLQKHHEVTILPHSAVSYSERKKCQNAGSLIINAFVHGIFNINVTFLHFVMTDVFHMYPFNNDCIGSPEILKTDMDGTSCEYCGAHYPSSTYFNKSNVSLKLDMRNGRRGRIDVVFEIGVIDKYIFHEQYSMHTGTMTWSDFKIQWYCINVEMLYRVMIHAGFPDKLKSIISIYDGPNENMPELLNYKYQLNETLLSSTFQIFIVFVSNNNMMKLALTYKAVRGKQIMLKPPQQIFLRNNTGCGIKDTKTWMCTYHIISPLGTQAELKVVSLDISGPCRNMYVSAGVAIYNVINQNRSLVAHWHRSIDATEGELIITGTENELHMVVFSYSPFAILSYHFSIDSSRCTGLFIGKFIRPSLLSIPWVVRFSTLDARKDQVLIQFSVTRGCLVVQLLFLPVEYPVSFRLIKITFTYKQALHVSKYSVGIDHMVYSCEIFGDYSRVRGETSFHISSLEIVGVVNVIDCWSASNSIMTILKVHRNECFLPCQAANIPITTVNGNHELCDICAYEWIFKYKLYALYYLPSYGSLKFERIYGNNSSLELCIVSEPRSCCTQQVYCYFSIETTFQFSEQRVMSATIYSSDVWRTKRLTSMKYDGRCQSDCSFPTENPVLFRLGAYEYIPKNTFEGSRIRQNWSSASYECGKIGAQLLTVFDRQELNFIIQNIMTPYAIEHVFIGMQRQVRKSFERGCQCFIFIILWLWSN